MSFIQQPEFTNTIFPWTTELSPGINKEEFPLSHLQQPELFLRLRPGKEAGVKQKLQTAGIQFTAISETCIALPNSSKITHLLEIDKAAVIQDYSSQRVREFLEPLKPGPPARVWDCCAASGGKSILAKDILGEFDLIVSDVRESILVSLQDRFRQAGIKNYDGFVADLSRPLTVSLSSFNLVIADVPCTGSGTWSRTPEQLFYFDPIRIEEYAALQKKIVSTAIPQLEPGGHLLYITCSVFKKENEEAVEFIKEKFHLQTVKMELLKGYDKKADTMFAALLKKPL
jgi:16S rRNA (cytosine967-C5)-methyltransferase